MSRRKLLGAMVSLVLMGTASRSYGYAFPWHYQTVAEASNKLQYFAGESLGVYIVNAQGAGWQICYDAWDGTQWVQQLCTPAGGAQALVVNFQGPAGAWGYFRYRTALASGSGPYLSAMASRLLGTAKVAFSTNTNVVLAPNAAPDNGSDVDTAIEIRHYSDLSLQLTCDQGGAGYVETCYFNTGSYTGAFLFVFVYKSGTKGMSISFNAAGAYSGSAASNTNGAGNSDAFKICTEITNKAGNKADDRQDTEVRTKESTGSVSFTACPTNGSVGFSASFPLHKCSGVKNVEDASSCPQGADGSVGFDFSNGVLTASASASFSHDIWICIVTTFCICGIDVTLGGGAQGSIVSGSGGKVDVYAEASVGLHCGLHWWACGYIGGGVRGGYRMRLMNGGAYSYLFGGYNALTYHALLVGTGPQGTLLSNEWEAPIGGSACGNGYCESGENSCNCQIDCPGSCCGNGIVDPGEQCDLGASNGQPGSCCTSSCTFVGSGATCRAAPNQCTTSATCTGASATCPANGYVAAGTSCSDTTPGDCYAARCDGAGSCNQTYTFQPAGSVCRVAANECDTASTCSGSSGSCPGDVCKAYGAACSIGYCSNCACYSSGGGGGGGGGCFAAGTQVAMADGTSMNIEEVQVGDRVLAFDENTRQVKSARVDDVLVHPEGSHQDGLYLVNGKIHATSNHAFFVNGVWKQLKDVRLGDTVYSLAGDRACPSTVAPEKVESIERLPDVETVYNLEIERYHTYFVHGVLVHNIIYKMKKAPPRPSPSGDYSAARKEEPKAELDPDLGRRR